MYLPRYGCQLVGSLMSAFVCFSVAEVVQGPVYRNHRRLVDTIALYQLSGVNFTSLPCRRFGDSILTLQSQLPWRFITLHLCMEILEFQFNIFSTRPRWGT